MRERPYSTFGRKQTNFLRAVDVFTGSKWPITLEIVSWENIADLHHEKSLNTPEFSYQRVKDKLKAKLARIRHYREEKVKNPIAAVRICKPGLERLEDLWKIHKYAHEVTKGFEKELDRQHTNGVQSFDFQLFTFEGFTINRDIEDRYYRIVEEVLGSSIMAKLLFVSRRARPDIQVAISFLTSRVTKADRDDWKKLKRVLQYLNWTIDMPLTLSIDNLCVVKTWVDAAFATHDDMRSHTGGIISMGKGALYASSRRQKINMKSSTEAELVGAADFWPRLSGPQIF
eukprot:scaffold14401_cov140-Cylindrotheca_fusiformis.AAC.2